MANLSGDDLQIISRHPIEGLQESFDERFNKICVHNKIDVSNENIATVLSNFAENGKVGFEIPQRTVY